MESPSNMLNMLKMILPKLKMFGINLNDIMQQSLKFIPELFIDKTKEFKKLNPELNVVVMIASKENEIGEKEVFLIPVGLDGVTIKKQGKPVNLNEFLSQLDVEEMFKNAGKEDGNIPDKENETNLIT